MTTDALPNIATLDELNKWAATRDSATCTARYAVGKVGTTRRGMTGSHGHMIRILISKSTQEGERDIEMAIAVCQPDRGSVGAVVKGADTDQATCSKCRAWLERSTKNIRGA